MWRLLVVLLVGTKAWACSCSGNWETPKEAWKNRPYVFLGSIIEASPDNGVMFESQMVRIRVDEAFKGVRKGQVIELPQGGTSCDSKFRTGQRSVFYLNRSSNGQFRVTWCATSFGSADPQGDDLLFLHGLPVSAKGTRLSGQVTPSSTGDGNGIAGVPIVIVSAKGKIVRTRKTNRAGVFEVYGLAAGKYTVQMEAPSGYRLPSRDDHMRSVELKPEGSVVAGLSLDHDTGVKGWFLDSAGKPLKGICLNLLAVGGNQSTGGGWHADCSKEDGTFQLDKMPPGEYFLRADLARNGEGRSTIYYSSTRSRRNARIVAVEAGKPVENIEFQLPGNEQTFHIRGRFLYADGRPVTKGNVSFTAAESDDYVVSAVTLPDGAFDLEIASGFRGSLKGNVVVLAPTLAKCPQFQPTAGRQGFIQILETSTLPLTVVKNINGLELKLASPSCEPHR